MTTNTSFIYDAASAVDPLGDAEREKEKGVKHNRAKVGSGRPSSLIYTYGPGSIMDLPQFTIMPTGLDDWDRIWRRRDGIPEIRAPRLREVVRMLLRSPNVQLRPFPWQPKKLSMSNEGNDLGVPARVFPQWLRCTGCDMLAPLSSFAYTNTHPYRTDLACFEHAKCTGRKGDKSRQAMRRPAVPARYLLACVDGHLDEFPYDLWVHRGKPCAEAEFPALKMIDRTAGRGATATIRCASCELSRPMNQAQGEQGALNLPRCRGRHAHLDAFQPGGCRNEARLLLVGASNLWFPATQSIIVMPESQEEQEGDLADRIRIALGDKLLKYRDNLDILRDLLDGKVNVTDLNDDTLAQVLALAAEPPATAEQQEERLRTWDPVDLLVPEWRYLQKDPLGAGHEDPVSGLALSRRDLDPELRLEITRVLAVERLRKVNALVGFTRIDAMDRVGDLPRRLVPLTRAPRPEWTVATEDRGEGIFLQLDEAAVANWEKQIYETAEWAAHQEAHRRNFYRRFSETAEDVDPDTRLKPPRYWLVHTLAHVLIRELALTCGYSAASLSERLYAWPEAEGRAAAAGLLICTTASDSDGTLGGLVQLSEPARLARVVRDALFRATRCSSDPICATRTPQDPEDFLHGAACHCCVMASETSCERANRFLDRRFLVNLRGSDLGFFGRGD
ncbi:DrmB family protein [Streptosporangium sp. NPDC001559]|uniref:DrmB family protein n=1 Tax=Streptosporangium sp. NPDC001559 TaxID=3366187 RepID=UPI0036EBD680